MSASSSGFTSPPPSCSSVGFASNEVERLGVGRVSPDRDNGSEDTDGRFHFICTGGLGSIPILDF